jgi:hypothetical protein
MTARLDPALQLERDMRTALLNLLPLVALTVCAACGGDGTGLPTGAWHHGSTTVGGTTGGSGGSGGGSSSNAASSGSGGGVAGGGPSSSGGSSGAESSSGGSTSSSGSVSSGSSSGATTSSGSSGGTASSSGGTGGQASNVAVSVAQSTLQLQLMAQATVQVSVAPNGYSGTVQLSPGTLPAGVTASFDHASLTLDGATTATATLTLKTDTNAPPGEAQVNVDATAGGTTKTATVTATVQSVITLHIPQGVDNMGATIVNPNTTAFGPYPITIVAPQGISTQNPVTVYFKNDDTVSHEIHADAGAQGFGHDPGSFGPGKMDPYVRKVNTAGTYDFYLHDQGSPLTIGRIHIQ